MALTINDIEKKIEGLQMDLVAISFSSHNEEAVNNLTEQIEGEIAKAEALLEEAKKAAAS